MVKNFKGKENVNNFHKIQACCPACNAFADKIEYQNSDAGNRIYCSGCGLVYNDADAGKAGFDDLIEYWNCIGAYMPQDAG